MKSSHSALFGAMGGAAVVALLLWPRDSAAAAPPRGGEQLPPAAQPTPVLVSTPLDLQPIASRLDQIVDRLRSLEERVERALAVPERSAVATSPTAVAVDADSLQQAMDEIARRKFEAMSDDELRQQAWRAMKGEGDRESATRALEILLERATTTEERSKALMDLGMLQRMKGGEADLAASARTLQSVIDTNGFDSALGLAAASQLVWTRSSQKDYTAALQQAEGIVRSSAATPEQRVNGRWAAAIMLQGLGDTTRARAEYQALLRDIEGQPERNKLAVDIRGRLEKL